MDIDEQFRQIINNQEDKPMTTSTKNPMNFGLAIGTILILAATLFAIIWAFGLDRFGILAAGSAAGGVVLLIAGTVITKIGKGKS